MIRAVVALWAEMLAMAWRAVWDRMVRWVNDAGAS